ncbi:hypothetical protein [Ruminococcus sp.]|uniref:hypothetical protein n=1 Tax=Ruminococcus sp. TaxID=41978 RepID=UPI002583CE7A|nr:hypothetical protein [Ruminococcus sp.]MCR5020531.1 hypothetical protein [Ruminococcus sp.]
MKKIKKSLKKPSHKLSNETSVMLSGLFGSNNECTVNNNNCTTGCNVSGAGCLGKIFG